LQAEVPEQSRTAQILARNLDKEQTRTRERNWKKIGDTESHKSKSQGIQQHLRHLATCGHRVLQINPKKRSVSHCMKLIGALGFQVDVSEDSQGNR
jgi:hypothetical protein